TAPPSVQGEVFRLVPAAPGGLYAFDVSMFRGQTVTLKGQAFRAPDGARYFEVQQFADGDRSDFIAGRVASNGKQLEFAGRKVKIPEPLQALIAGGMPGRRAAYANTGMIIWGD